MEDTIKNKSSYNALIARGFDSNLAKYIVNQGYTLGRLQTLDSKLLKKIGINESLIEILQKENRPPIPDDTLIKLLFESKCRCCICRDDSRGIVIHHIKEWNESHSHEENNLVVLCPLHHDEAHTKRNLTITLTPEKILALKKEWTEIVKIDDRKAILEITSRSESRWDYFNHNRIFELYLKNKISNRNYRSTSNVKALGLINSLGTFPVVNDPNRIQLYHFDNGYLQYYYMAELFSDLLINLPFIDITDKFTKKELKSLISPGIYIAIQAGFYFKNKSKINKGLGQERFVYYKKRGIQIEFTIDPYECTSVSSYCCHLSKHRNATVIGLVKSMIEEKGNLYITISCLSIGCYMETHLYWKNRDYQGYELLNSEGDIS